MNGIVDRISKLPADVLNHILSFVSTKEVVHTCILPKRWRNTWASVPVLKFQLDEFLVHNSDDELWALDSDDEISNKYWIDQFVNGMLENRGQPGLDTVIYDGDFKNSYHWPSMEWLDRAALLMPRIISVCIRGVGRLNFLNSMFSCASLENLELCSKGVDWLNIPKLVSSSASLENMELFLFRNVITSISPKTIALPSLKILKLHFSSLDDDFARKLFLGCPSLESLNLESCYLFISDISSNMLKKLTVDEC